MVCVCLSTHRIEYLLLLSTSGCRVGDCCAVLVGRRCYPPFLAKHIDGLGVASAVLIPSCLCPCSQPLVPSERALIKEDGPRSDPNWPDSGGGKRQEFLGTRGQLGNGSLLPHSLAFKVW